MELGVRKVIRLVIGIMRRVFGRELKARSYKVTTEDGRNNRMVMGLQAHDDDVENGCYEVIGGKERILNRCLQSCVTCFLRDGKPRLFCLGRLFAQPKETENSGIVPEACSMLSSKAVLDKP